MEKQKVQRLALSVAEAAESIGISTTQAYNLIHAGQLPAKQVGSRWLVPVRALERWVAETDNMAL